MIESAVRHYEGTTLEINEQINDTIERETVAGNKVLGFSAVMHGAGVTVYFCLELDGNTTAQRIMSGSRTK